MALIRDVAPADQKPMPHCSLCGKPSRAREALYWGARHLCDGCELAWGDTVDLLAKVPDDMGSVFEAWAAQRKTKARVAA